MNARRIALSIGVVLVGLALAWPVRGQSGDIIVNNADATTTLTVTGSSDLNTLITDVGPRSVLQHANSIWYYGISPIPSDLQTLLGQVGHRSVIQYANSVQYYGVTPIPSELQALLGQVGHRLIIQYANSVQYYGLTAIPSDLQTLLGQVDHRLVIQHANSNLVHALAYPVGLIGDTTPPGTPTPTPRPSAQLGEEGGLPLGPIIGIGAGAAILLATALAVILRRRRRQPTCPYCGTPYKPGARFCTQCGRAAVGRKRQKE